MYEDILKELEPRFKETCETFVENGGICRGIQCIDCPFLARYNKEVTCIDNGYTSLLDACEQDTVLVESAKKWLKYRPEDNYTIVIPGQPVVLKNGKRMVTNKHTGKIMPIKSKKVERYYKSSIPVIKQQVKAPVIDYPVHLELIFYGAWKSRGGNVPDLSNLYEAVQDLFTKCGVYVDDRLVESHDGSRRVCLCDNCPRRKKYVKGPKAGQYKADCGAVKKCPFERVVAIIRKYDKEEVNYDAYYGNE